MASQSVVYARSLKQERCVPSSNLSQRFPYFIVRFPDGLFLHSYTSDEGVSLTAQRDRARIFRNPQTAETVARILRGEVCEIHQQKNPPVNPTATQLECCKILVELSGAQFAGIFPSIKGHAEPLVLFNSKQTGTTLACTLAEVSAELIRHKIAESNAAFGVQP